MNPTPKNSNPVNSALRPDPAAVNPPRLAQIRSIAAALLACAFLTLAAHAQKTAGAMEGSASSDEPIQLQTFSVTGSNIKRLDVESALPVTVLGRETMETRGASQAADLLTALPEITGLPGNETAFAGAAARGDNATISMRGLPSANTLILLDGRRLVPHPISQSEAGTPTLSVNVNQLPNQGIDHIDVLRDGASSIYGTDAVAGVVNYQMKKDFRGTSILTHYGETEYHDGIEYRATLTHGQDFAQGKGRILLVADYYNRGAIYSANRPFASNPDNSYRAPPPWNTPTNTTFNLLSSSSAYGSYILGTVTGTDPTYGTVTTFAGARPTGVPASYAATTGLFVLTPLVGGGVGFASATPARTAAGPGHDYYWNNSAYRVIQPKSKRTNLFTSGEYDLTPKITTFTELSLYQANSTTYREPDAYSQSTDGYLIVPATNPYNPFGTRFWSPTGTPNADGTARLTGTPTAVSITNKRFIDFATRTDSVTDSVYRGVWGVRGKLFESWTWEGALLYSTARGIEYEAGATRRSLLAAAINQTDPTKAFNPFGQSFAVQNGALVATGAYQNPQTVISTFQAPYIRNGITKLGSADFHAGGDVLEIWGGNKIGAAFGGEFRYEAYDDYRPPYAGLNPPGSGLDPTNDDFVSFSPNSDTHGNRHVGALYAETVIPLAGNKFTLPLVRSLEISASGRFEHYSDFGSTTKPKVGVDWRPLSWLLVRASYNQGFHAPNLAELFTGTLTRTVTSSTDTYRSLVTNLATDGPSNRRSISAGNRSLQPETSTGKSAGIVIDVPHVRGLSISVDYWEIAQKNVIASGGGIPDDTAALLAATQAALASGQSINSINLGSGTASYKGDPSVVRLPVTAADQAAFAAYNATQAPGNQRAVVGAVSYINNSYFNKARQFVNGFDLDLNYRLPRLAIGQFTFDSAWTNLDTFYAYTSSTAPRTDYRQSNSANVGGATPVWRGSSSLTWRRKQWGGGIGMYYIGRYTDTNATTTQAIWDSLGDPKYIQPVFTNGAFSYRYVVHDTKMYNVFASYQIAGLTRWLDGTKFRLGVNNVLDEKPPLVSGSSQGFETSVYSNMARGRMYSFEISRTF
jgi:outer membrane receptor protein involved in Fe transport